MTWKTTKPSEVRMQERHKVVLLGTGQSGKSTLFRQMMLRKETPEGAQKTDSNPVFKFKTDLQSHRIAAHFNSSVEKSTILNQMFRAVADTLIKMETQINWKIPAAGQLLIHKRRNEPRLRKSAYCSDLTMNVINAINDVWRDPVFREAWEELGPGAPYAAPPSQDIEPKNLELLLDNLQDYPVWGGPEWYPSCQEMLLSRVRTTGIPSETLEVTKPDGEQVIITYTDSGGEQSERSKWRKTYEEVSEDGYSYFVFVVSLAGYCRQLFEASSQNQMVDSLRAFETVSKDIAALDNKNAKIVLVFNKFDVFKELMKKKILLNQNLFPGAPTVADTRENLKYIINMFIKRAVRIQLKPVVCSAIKFEEASNLFDNLRGDIVKRSFTARRMAATRGSVKRGSGNMKDK